MLAVLLAVLAWEGLAGRIDSPLRDRVQSLMSIKKEIVDHLCWSLRWELHPYIFPSFPLVIPRL